MKRDQRLKEGLDRLAGPVDQRGVWSSIEERAFGDDRRNAKLEAASLYATNQRMRLRRARLTALAAVALVVIAGVVVGATVGLDGGLVVFGTDDGSDGHWEKLPVAGEGGSVWAIKMDPEDHDTLYNLSRDGVFKSTDGAESWQRILSFWDGGSYRLTLIPGSPSTLLVTSWFSSPQPSEGDWSHRLMKSDDGGETWVDITDNLRSAVKDEYSATGLGQIQFFEHHEAELEAEFPGTIFLTVVPPRQGLPYWWKSSDQGTTWTALDEVESEDLGDHLHPVDPEEMRRWSWIPLKDASGNVLGSSLCAVIDPDDPSLIYAGTTSGVCRSTDGGDTWVDVSKGIDHEVGGSLVIDPALPSTMYLDTSEGIFKSDDDGATWRHILLSYDLNDGEGGDNSIWSFMMAPSQPSTLYAWKSDGLFRSEDGGETWSKRQVDVPSGVDAEEMHPSLVAVAPDDPDSVYAVFYTGSYHDLFRSEDGGESWTPMLENGGLSGLLFDPNDPFNLYTTKPNGYREGDSMERSVVRSVDGGATWQTVRQADGSSLHIALGAGDPTPLYVFDQADVWRSLDGGTSWEHVESEGLPGPVVWTVYDGRSSGVWYGLSVEYSTEAGLPDREVYRSSDGGVTWVTAFETMPRGCWGIAIEPGQNGSLYAYGSGGVYRWGLAEDDSGEGDGGEGDPSDSSESSAESPASSGGWGCSGD